MLKVAPRQSPQPLGKGHDANGAWTVEERLCTALSALVWTPVIVNDSKVEVKALPCCTESSLAHDSLRYACRMIMCAAKPGRQLPAFPSPVHWHNKRRLPPAAHRAHLCVVDLPSPELEHQAFPPVSLCLLLIHIIQPSKADADT